MKIVRKNVFETNSSSTHSISICSTEDFKKWEMGKLFYCFDENKFYTLEERDQKLAENNIDLEHTDKYNDNLYEYPITIDEFYDNICQYYDYFVERATIQGVDLTAFGYYGQDS